MKHNALLYWLLPSVIVGFDGDDDNEGGNEGENDDNANDDNENDDEDANGTNGDGSNDEGDDVEKLRKALATQRRIAREEKKGRRKAERELNEAKTAKNAEQEASELNEATKQREAADAKVQKMAKRLLNKERDDAILAEARRQKFIDPTDALTDDIRGEIDIDQDDDDPSDIDVDEASVRAAVRKLATKKKHLIQGAADDEPSGGRFGRRSGGSNDSGGKGEPKITELYPSLG